MTESKGKFFNFSEILKFLTSRTFIINLLLIAFFLLFVVFGIFQWLKSYTNHGQRLLLPDYIGTNVVESKSDAQDREFQMIVNDSTHIVGTPGGVVLSQNPKGGSYIKENRKIYVTISKYMPDLISLDVLPSLYGENFEMKSKELRSRQLKPRIMSTKYDPISSYTILEVWYNGEKIVDKSGRKKNVEIEKGSYIDLVVSQPDGGVHTIPRLVGKSLGMAKMILNVRKLLVGEVVESGDIPESERERAIITEQYPEYDGTSMLSAGEKINLVISIPK